MITAIASLNNQPNVIHIPVVTMNGEPLNSTDYLDQFTQTLNISVSSPLDWAVPLYGYLMPILVAVTTVTNSFIMIVLSQKHLRTPTNIVLLAMAITDLLTGFTSVPWFLYYYTLQGYKIDKETGLQPFWCHAHAYLFEILPSIFHTGAIWLTVFLAIQRYVYVCVPGSVHVYCTPKTTKGSIIGIMFAAFLSVCPQILCQRRLTHYNPWKGRYDCYIITSEWVRAVGSHVFFTCYYWSRIVLHAVPCILLIIFTYKLAHTIQKAENRKRSWISTNNSYNDGRKHSTNGRVPFGSGRSMYATNRMLAVICTVFLFLEIPAAILYAMQVLMAMKLVVATPDFVLFVNRIVVIRNLLIVMASPIQFAIYCSMSEQFRLTVRQLFTSRLLFVAQAQATFHGGKRYSLILVDVEESKKLSAGLKSITTSRFFDRTKKASKKIMRQGSLQLADTSNPLANRRGGSMRPSIERQRKTVYRVRDGESNAALELKPLGSSNHLQVPSDYHTPEM